MAQLTLQRKIVLAVAGVLLLAVAACLALLRSAYHSRSLIGSLVAENVASVRAAEELEIALLEQRGLVSAYVLDDGDPRWLRELQLVEPHFGQWLDRARQSAVTAQERVLVDSVAAIYAAFDRRRQEAVALFQGGERDAAKRVLLGEVRDLFADAYEQCERYLEVNEGAIDGRIEAARREVRRNEWIALAYLGLTVGLAGALLAFVFRGILRPLQQLASEAPRVVAGGEPAARGDSAADAVRQVGARIHSLMSDVTETRGHLERSRAQLLSSDKLATVGKLAASVAHEIRNPLTAIKMRLFYLRGEVGGDPRYGEDFRVVAEEIARLEGVIQNFLEFSRPPDLKLQVHDVDDLLDRTLALCGHRLQGRAVDVRREPHGPVPPVRVDAEQTKQVFLNLVLNAAEAMPGGGTLALRVRRPAGGAWAVVEFADSGPGIPEAVRDRIFEPFFSTKEEGTGLGLAIAAGIAERQGGRLELRSTSPGGTTFAVCLPMAGGGDADDPGR